jgi:hypothetical protein
VWSAIIFVGALAVASLFVARADDARLQKTALLMGVNWACCVIIQWLSGTYTPWFALMLLDGATAYTVLHPPERACKTQAAIGATLGFQVLIHMGFGAVGILYGPVAQGHALDFYLWTLGAGGLAQVAMLFAGATYDKGRRIFGPRLGRLARRANLSPGFASLEQWWHS